MDQNTKPNNQFLRFLPLGGMGEVTKNMYVYETANDLVVIDCGIGFPEEAATGQKSENEVIIPDFSYVLARQNKLRALLVTHGHEDHIGGIPYFLKRVRTPIYTAWLTAGLIREKLKERGPKKAEIREMSEDQRVNLGQDFSFELIRLTHSIPDAMAIALTTPLGVAIHTGDFKLDPTPLDRRLSELGKIEDYGQRGVTLLASDCLRADREGSSPSERIVGETFFHEIQKTKGRVFITMFSSDISRIQQAIDVASALGRTVTLAGLSLERNFEVARDLGYLAVAKGQVTTNEKLRKLPVSKQLILVSGAQGQENSALSKMVRGEHRTFKIGQGDLVMFSSDLIPGNEERVDFVQEQIRNLGAKVLHLEEVPEIHVSGHGYAEDLKKMIQAARATYLAPIGGTTDTMEHYAKLAKGYNYRDDQIFLLENGQTLEFVFHQGRSEARLGKKILLKEFSIIQK